MRHKLLSILALLIVGVCGAKAGNYTVNLKSEYTSVATIYAGVPNYFTLTVKNDGEDDGTNILVSIYVDGVLIDTKTIDSLPANEMVTLENICDLTIRPITENTVNGNNNEYVTYTIIVEDGDGVISQDDFKFVVLYNGNLGKDYAYPSVDPMVREYSFNGDVQVHVGTNYSSGSATSGGDKFSVDLNGGTVQQALLYVAYNWDKAPNGDFNNWTTSFNSNEIKPYASYRDQGNLGKYGNYGYGMVVYDVTEYVINGTNTFALEKETGNVTLYPSSLIVMVNNPSASPKAVYLIEEADLLSAAYNKNVTAMYPTSFHCVAGESATLYVFAASAQAGEGDLKINGVTLSDVWSGTSQSFDTFETTVDPGDISVQFIGTGSSIMALHQMVVVDKPKGGIVTGIEQIGADKGVDKWYDLQGRMINQAPVHKGLYIRNGRKVVVE